MYDFGIEEKEFQLMLDVANEKLELNENRFRIISNTMHRVRDSGKLSEYDKVQVGLLCNKFSIAVENLNGKTEYEVAMEEMSGGMMALVAAAIAAVIAILAKIFGFFGSKSGVSTPTPDNIKGLNDTKIKGDSVIKDIGNKLIETNKLILSIDEDKAVNDDSVKQHIKLAKRSNSFLYMLSEDKLSRLGKYPASRIIVKPDKWDELNKLYSKIDNNFSNKILKKEVNRLSLYKELTAAVKSSNTEQINTIIKKMEDLISDINDDEVNTDLGKASEIKNEFKNTTYTVEVGNVWNSLTNNYNDNGYSNIGTINGFILFLNDGKEMIKALEELQEAIKTNTSIEGLDSLSGIINRYKKHDTYLTRQGNLLMDELINNAQILDTFLSIIEQIIKLLKLTIKKMIPDAARDIISATKDIIDINNRFIDGTIEFFKTLPKFEKSRTTDVFSIIGEFKRYKTTI